MIDEIVRDTRRHMEKSVESLRHDLSAIRTGRASPALLDRITVEYYGTPTPLNQLALINVPEARILTIKPYDRTTMGLIEKAILKSDLGLNPSNDGQLIRLVLPQLTEQRRKELVKQSQKRVEEAKVALRNIRRDAIKDMQDAEKEDLITEDDLESGKEQVQKLTDKVMDQLESIGKAKEAEIMEV
ncbi:MAG: ribosome recycling factor [Anaerolineae bacterium]|nr:ribosome recycling factor [Anaerolineae bacterium]